MLLLFIAWNLLLPGKRKLLLLVLRGGGQLALDLHIGGVKLASGGRVRLDLLEAFCVRILGC